MPPIMPTEPASDNNYLAAILTEMKALNGNFNRLEQAFLTHVEHCRVDMGKLYDWQKDVIGDLGFRRGVHETKTLYQKIRPHIIHGALVGVGLLVGLYMGGGIKH